MAAADPLKYFRVEARELVEQLGAAFLEVERDGASAEVVARLLRFAHTLKGAARVVKQLDIAKLAHEIEDVLAPLRDSRGNLTRERLERALALVDEIGTQVRGLAPPQEEVATPAAEEPFRTLRTDVAEMDTLLRGIAETQTRVGALRRTVESLGKARRLADAVAEHAGAPAAREGTKAVALSSDLRALLSDLEGGLAADAERVERELREVRAAGERLRLLPVSSLFGSLERAVRDAARSLGKRAVFRGAGGEVRLDGYVLGALQPALVQLVRNAMAHGVEGEAERVAAGKPAEGSVFLQVSRRGARVSLVCRDDGRGIDLASVRQALQRKGLSPPAAGAQNQDELLRLLLEGGVSTSSAVTDVSGRGVGLDIVRDAASRLGAQVLIRTSAGQGTSVEIVVPVSLSSVEALVVEAAGARAAIPMDTVVKTMRLRRDDLARSPEGDALAHQGELIPFARLDGLLGEASELRDMMSAVVFAVGERTAAIGVDRLLEGTTVLVHALPALAPVKPMVAGVFVDAEGQPQAVLDPERLLEAVRQAEPERPHPSSPRVPVLVVDDSLTTRMLEQSILESAGYLVELATSGEEALEKARRQRYGLFLVDVEMPGMDGFAVLEHFRADPELRDIPAILVTSRSSPEDRRRGAQVGARAYVVKSEFDQVELLRRIRSLVS